LSAHPAKKLPRWNRQRIVDALVREAASPAIWRKKFPEKWKKQIFSFQYQPAYHRADSANW